MKTSQKAVLLFVFCFLLMVSFVQPAKVDCASGEYPTKSIKFVIPVAPGSTLDGISRKLNDLVGKSLGQEIIIDSKPGAGSLVGVTTIAKAKPDGYTLGMMTSSIFVTTPFFTKMDIDPFNELTPIIEVIDIDYWLAVRAESPIKTLQQFIEEGRKRQLSVGDVGLTDGDITLRTLAVQTKADVKVVPMGGTAPAILAALGGQIDACLGSSGVDYFKSGKLRMLARLQGEPKKGMFKDIPTLRELGYDLEAVSFAAVAGPKGLPGPIQKKLEEEYTRALHDPSTLEFIQNFGVTMVFRNSNDLKNHLKMVHERAREKIKALKLGMFAEDKK